MRLPRCDPPDAVRRLRGGEHGQRRGERGGVGVEGVVDQLDRLALARRVDHHCLARAAARRRRPGGQRHQRPRPVRAKRRRRRQDAPGRSARNARPRPRPSAGRACARPALDPPSTQRGRECRSAGDGLSRRCSESDDACRQAASLLPEQDRRHRQVAVDDCGPARLQTLEDRGLLARDAVEAAMIGEGLQVRRRDSGDHRHVRPGEAGQRRRSRRDGSCRSRSPQSGCPPASARASAARPSGCCTRPRRHVSAPRADSTPTQHLLGRGLADRAGDGDDLGPRCARARRGQGPAAPAGCPAPRAAARPAARPSGRRETRAAAAPRLRASATKSWPSRSASSATKRSPGRRLRLSIETPVAVQDRVARPPVAASASSDVQSGITGGSRRGGPSAPRPPAAGPPESISGKMRRGASDPAFERGDGDAGLLGIVERQDRVADDLAGLVALAADQQRVPRAQERRRRAGSPRPDRRPPGRLARPPAPRRGSRPDPRSGDCRRSRSPRRHGRRRRRPSAAAWSGRGRRRRRRSRRSGPERGAEPRCSAVATASGVWA